MKPLLALRCAALFAGALALGGCASLRSLTGTGEAARAAPAKPAAPALTSDGTAQVDIDGVPIVKVPFRPGVSSVTVERMARQAACTGGVGAGLVTPPGPVEVYRMMCSNGKVFLARCELRQCQPMP